MFRENILKKRIKAGQRALGCWTHMNSPIAAEIMALAGFDGAIIDHEHGSGDLYNAVALMQAMSATPTASILRVPWNDFVYIKRALDTGAEGILVPSVNTAEEARAVASACRYPPKGIRGAAFPISRAASYGMTDNYLRDYEENLLIICQVEAKTAVENIDELVAVEGIDMLFIGPMDLSCSIGKPGQLEDPEFLDIKARAEEAIKKSDKFLGGLCTPVDPPKQMFAKGYDFVAGALDVALLREASKAHILESGRDD